MDEGFPKMSGTRLGGDKNSKSGTCEMLKSLTGKDSVVEAWKSKSDTATGVVEGVDTDSR